MHSGDGIVHGNDKYGLCKRMLQPQDLVQVKMRNFYPF